jgi:hypothetical protein
MLVDVDTLIIIIIIHVNIIFCDKQELFEAYFFGKHSVVLAGLIHLGGRL